MRPGVNNGYVVFALVKMLLWSALAGNIRVLASEYESDQQYQLNQENRPYELHRIYARSADGISEDGLADGNTQDTPTIFPDTCGDVVARAAELFTALDGSNDDRQTVIKLLSTCTRAQRQEIARVYSEKYNKDLIDAMDAKYSSDYEFNLLTKQLTVPLPRVLADFLFEAMQDAKLYKMKYVLTPLVDDATTAAMKELFDQRNQGTLTEGIRSEILNSPLINLFRSISSSAYNGKRSSDDTVDEKLACADAEKINEDKKSNRLLDVNSDFYNILTTKSFPQLRQTAKCFEASAGISLVQALSSLLYPLKQNQSKRGEVDACIEILRYAENKAAFFAEALNASVRYWGTDDELLIFIIAWRGDIDLGDIKRAYKELYGTSLFADVEGDTSGEYRDLLLTIIGE